MTTNRLAPTLLLLALLWAPALLAADTAAADDAARHAHRGNPPIVLIHGLGSNAKVWSDVDPFLRGTFDVWTFELSGHGTTQPVDHPTIAGEAKRLEAWIKENGIDYPVLVGHGVGGMIALRYTLDHQAGVRRLIVLDTVARPMATLDQQTDMAAKLASDYDRTVAERYLGMTPSQDIADRIVDDALRTDSASFIELLLDTNRFDVRSELEYLSVPLLVVGSEMMLPSGVDPTQVLAQVGFAHARSISFKAIEQSGHFMMLERPVYVASVLLAFGAMAEAEQQN